MIRLFPPKSNSTVDASRGGLRMKLFLKTRAGDCRGFGLGRDEFCVRDGFYIRITVLSFKVRARHFMDRVRLAQFISICVDKSN